LLVGWLAGTAHGAEPVELVTKWFEGYRSGDLGTTFASFADDATWLEVGEREAKGRAAIVELHEQLRKGWTEVKAKPSRLIISGDNIAIELVWSGFSGDKYVSYNAAMVWRLGKDGRVAQAWSIHDGTAVKVQLGLWPVPPGFTPPSLPRPPLVLMAGTYDPKLMEPYEALNEQAKKGTLGDAVERLFADDFKAWDPALGRTLTRAELKESMEGSMKYLSLIEVEPILAFGTADMLVVLDRSRSKYLGGIPGTEARAEPIVHWSIGIAHIKKGRFVWATNYADSREVYGPLGL